MENTSGKTVSQLAVEVAVSQLGQQEVPKGSNKGPMVDQYLKSVGITFPAAWCQAFLYWCYLEASRKAGLHCPVVRTGGVLDCWNKTAENLKVHATEALSRPDLLSAGDQIIFKHGAGTGHTGMVVAVDKDSMSVSTIEGNTNHDGSREGYEVERKIRKLNDPHLLGFICYGKVAQKAAVVA